MNANVESSRFSAANGARRPAHPAGRRARAARGRGRLRGLGLVEAMIALAITATLLTAVAAAFNASASAINENYEFFKATQAGRVAINRMLTQVRRGTPSDASTATKLTLYTDTLQLISYQFDPVAKQLIQIRKENGLDKGYTLARDITACKFEYDVGDDPTNPDPAVTCVTRVTITLTVAEKNNRILLSGSAAPRSSLAF